MGKFRLNKKLAFWLVIYEDPGNIKRGVRQADPIPVAQSHLRGVVDPPSPLFRFAWKPGQTLAFQKQEKINFRHLTM